MSDPLYPYIGGGFPGSDGGPRRRRYSDFEVDLIAARYTGVPPPYASPADVGYFDAQVGARRSAEVLYHQSFMGSHSTIGQSEALYSSDTMVKRPRLESSLPIYPQRPGARDCAFYMRTRTCRYGEACKFDHPQWVPEGGVPNWKEVPNIEDSYPERPGEPDCPYFIKTGKCKFKSNCKFNHPKEKVNALEAGTDNEQSLIADSAILPVRPSEPLCSFYAKTGKCRFGAKCKFNHPKDIEIPPFSGKETIYTATDAAAHNVAADGSVPAKKHAQAAPAEAHNAKGLPIRPGEVDCSFYMKTGSCMYGSVCRYNHPDRPVVDIALMAPVVQSILPTAAPAVPAAVLNPVSSFLQSFDIHATHVPVEPEPIIYPQRPGETVCDFYMKTGYCKYSEKCKFHHPQQTVTLTLAGLPRREEFNNEHNNGVCGFQHLQHNTRCRHDPRLHHTHRWVYLLHLYQWRCNHLHAPLIPGHRHYHQYKANRVLHQPSSALPHHTKEPYESRTCFSIWGFLGFRP
ncbi:zinc finger CCCH domain-containing protein 8-like isoform X3 [Phragmites australis]|uniref:zinc finger CCCH domain-containing protein 8-like isoform X3 n=1 Tax=Phragmites australis TaxID=29695 RepID=UPI002D77E9DF|nr:zinc finger CCCH domain-containing protein 8-like isoform X3 [Phragmites australis]